MIASARTGDTIPHCTSCHENSVLYPKYRRICCSWLANIYYSGLGWSLTVVVIGRLVAGVGGAGINCLVSIVIAGMYIGSLFVLKLIQCLQDMVPIREAAKWRGYVNIAATTGRSLGGPIGGFLTDTVGWRW